ncbi:MAG: NAD(P)/FAD-dependent oxidoreductase [Syntrophales bacterium]|nr:NAD(P)/FAD-dependent oxidoreductase [Syntrophales bacterium]
MTNNKSIIIIGSGMGGLAAGVYGQLNGYQTQIFEMHTLPGGQCTSWERKGYTFDACIHHLFGCHPGGRVYSLWHELGAMPRELVRTQECVSVLSADGKLFNDFYDLEKLEHHLTQLSPADSASASEYIKAVRQFSGSDFMGAVMLGNAADAIKAVPAVIPALKWFKPTMRQFALRFHDPFLRKAFELLVYSNPDVSFFFHAVRHALALNGDIQWPAGGSLEFARSIEKRYLELGGQIFYRQKVETILVKNDRAVGIRLDDGTEHRADIVISNADGRKTIINMLGGKYTSPLISAYNADPPDESTMAVQVFLGVNRDLSREPSALIMLLDKPVTIAGHEHESLELQIYGFDPSMAPSGKGTIKVELTSKYSFWQKLHADIQAYKAEKSTVAEQVIEILENHFKGIGSQIEVTDVATLITWERFMGGTHGWPAFPNKKAALLPSLLGTGQTMTLPGLSNFYLTGQWVTAVGALFANAQSGKKAIQAICRKDGRKFITA